MQDRIFLNQMNMKRMLQEMLSIRTSAFILKEKIKEEFDSKDFPIPSSISIPVISSEVRRQIQTTANSATCLAQNAVHAALAGKTDFVVGYWNNEFTLLPIPMAVAKRKKIDVEGELWWNVLEATGQPISMKNP
ncbi:MAG: hypothetical protein MZV63_29510 [Marinilabiliales bacterium]|nr:hypothetical protein [Marinilabiliales bacterium]